MRISICSVLYIVAVASTASGCAGRHLHKSVCYAEPTSLPIRLPVPADAEIVDGGELVALQYTVQPHGTVQMFLTREHEYQDLGIETVATTPDEVPEAPEPFLGLRVVDVRVGSTADQAGVRIGDIIESLNGEPMSTPQRFNYMVHVHPQTQTARLKLIRQVGQQTEKVELSVDIGVRREPKERYESFNIPVTEELDHAGLVLGTVTPAVSRYLPEAARNGVLVLNIQAGSPAADSGLRVGDVISSIGSTAVTGAANVVAAVKRAAARGDELEVVAHRGAEEVRGTLEPVKSLPGDSSLVIPFVANYERNPHRTYCRIGPRLVRGILLDYERLSCFDASGEHFEEWGYGMFLDLIYFEKTRNKHYMSLLWWIRWSW